MKKRQREKLINLAGGMRSIVAFTPTGEYIWANINWKARKRRWMYFSVPQPMDNMQPVKTLVFLPHIKRPNWSVHIRMGSPVADGDTRTWIWVELNGDAEGLQPTPFQQLPDMNLLWQHKGPVPLEW